MVFFSPYKSNPAHYASRAPKGTRGYADVSPNSIEKTYDYVIIGCGTAGSVLASRLSEDPKVSVCVLEAGGNHENVLETRVPIAFGKLFHTQHDWDYVSAPQEGVLGREMMLPRGKIVGGCSSLNAMMHQSVPPTDVDEWSQKLGCKGWAYKDLLPYIRRTEKFTMHAQRPAIDLSHRGDSGEWQTGYSYLTEIGENGFIKGCQEVGIPYVPDINTPAGPLGVSRFQTFIDQKGQRSSAATAFLPPAVLARENLTIGIHAHVTRILTDSSSGEAFAFGAEFQTKQKGPYWRVRASREVILCGGAYNTPQTLMLSGIGPADELKKHGIKVVRESKDVGKNLYDHLCPSGLYAKAKSPSMTLDYLTSELRSLPTLARWFITGGGPATSNIGETAAFVRTCELDSSVKDHGSLGKGPDVEMIFTPLSFRDHGETGSPPGTGTVSLAMAGLRPQSVGSVTLQNADPWSKVVIDHKYLTDKEGNDRKVYLAAYRLGLKVIRSEAMKPYLADHVDDDPESYWWPASASNHDAITDEQLLAYMGKNAFTLYHPVCTARMGPKEDSVVDLQLRVRGVKNLRVCDASIFPTQISGHPTSAIICIASKAADLIRGRVADNADATSTAPVASAAAVPAAPKSHL